MYAKHCLLRDSVLVQHIIIIIIIIIISVYACMYVRMPGHAPLRPCAHRKGRSPRLTASKMATSSASSFADAPCSGFCG